MTQSDHDFVAQIFSGCVAGVQPVARRSLSVPVWFSVLALGAIAAGAALGFAI